MGAAEGCRLGNADGLAVGLKSDGVELITDVSTLVGIMGDADGALLGRGESLGSLLPVPVGPVESVGSAVFVTVAPVESVGS